MFVCEVCGRVIDEPIYNKEYDTGYRTETCPYCGGDDIKETNKCLLCGEPTENEYDEFCQECMEGFECYVERIIRSKVSANPEEVLASYYEGSCEYCNGGNCDACKSVTESAIAVACDLLGCSKDEMERIAGQKYGW